MGDTKRSPHRYPHPRYHRLMTKRILHIVTNVGQYDNGDSTGLWLSGLTTVWDRFEQRGFEQDIASPRGGDVPLDPRSLKFPFAMRAQNPG